MSENTAANRRRSLPELIADSNHLKEQSIRIKEKLVEVNQQIRGLSEATEADRSESTNSSSRHERGE